MNREHRKLVFLLYLFQIKKIDSDLSVSNKNKYFGDKKHNFYLLFYLKIFVLWRKETKVQYFIVNHLYTFIKRELKLFETIFFIHK